MNATTNTITPPKIQKTEKPIPPWLYYTCPPMQISDKTLTLHHNVKRYERPPILPTPRAHISTIKVALCHDRTPENTIKQKEATENPLIQALEQYGWQVSPLIIGYEEVYRLTTCIPKYILKYVHLVNTLLLTITWVCVSLYFSTKLKA